MALAPDGPTGRRGAGIAVFDLLRSPFDPISGGPGAITAAQCPGSVAGARGFWLVSCPASSSDHGERSAVQLPPAGVLDPSEPARV